MKNLFILFSLLFIFSCKSTKDISSTDASVKNTQNSSSLIKSDLNQNTLIDSMMSGELTQSSEFIEEEEIITETYTMLTVSDTETKKVPIKITTLKKVSYKIDSNFEGDVKYSKDLDTQLNNEESNQRTETNESKTIATTENKTEGFNLIKNIFDGIFSHWVGVVIVIITFIIIIAWKIFKYIKF